MDSPPIPEPLLEEIFLRLPTLADLARASDSFRAFRRLVTEQSFLRLYRKLHAPPPPLVGFLLRNRKFLPVDPSYSTASAAGAIAGAADFSFKFLPANPSCYAVSDIRDGRVLLNLQPFDNRCLVVCDPLHRRFALLPPIPSSYDWVEPPRLKAMGGPPPTIQVQAFLAPAAADEEAGEDTSFRVFWMASKQKKQNQLQLAFVFSSVTGQWETIPLKISLALHSQRQYACCCFYWVTDCGKNLLVLDAHTAEFSLADLPPQVRDFDDVDVDIAIVEAGEGCLGAFFLEYGTSDLSYIVRRNSDESSNQWELEKTISLSSSSYSFGNCTATHLFLHDCGSGSNDGALFSLDIKTFKLEKVFASQYGMRALDFHAYSNFPPILSTPTISSEMYSVENTGASENTSGSGQLVWTNSMSTMMLNYLVVLVAVGASTSDQFTRVHHNYCAKALSGHFKVAITSKQVCNHIKKWREIWGKVEKVKYSSGALWDASTCNIRHSEKHSAGHSKARKDIPFLKTSVEQCRAMERIFGTTTAKSGSETLSVKVREIEEDVVGDENGEVNLLRNVGEPSNSKPPPKKKAKVVNTENDA